MSHTHACKKCGTPLRPYVVMNRFCQLMYCPNEKCGITQIVSVRDDMTDEEAQEEAKKYDKNKMPVLSSKD